MAHLGAASPCQQSARPCDMLPRSLARATRQGMQHLPAVRVWLQGQGLPSQLPRPAPRAAAWSAGPARSAPAPDSQGTQAQSAEGAQRQTCAAGATCQMICTGMRPGGPRQWQASTATTWVRAAQLLPASCVRQIIEHTAHGASRSGPKGQGLESPHQAFEFPASYPRLSLAWY